MNKITGTLIVLASMATVSAYAANPASTDYVDKKVRTLEATDNSLQAQINTIGSGGASGHYVGEFSQGGVIYWLDPTSTSHNTHGLIADIADKGSFQWSVANTSTGATLNGAYQGQNIGTFNTAKILATPGTTYPAASACATSASQGYSDWYLPSIMELALMFDEQMTIRQTAIANGGSAFADINSGISYWSSTEGNAVNAAWVFNFNLDSQLTNAKSNVLSVRCVRAF